ncbi:alpha-amylase [candidate division WWE3 bacterium]|nr:alpha-amylase [candidate division WWE3 bacterium]
MNQDINFLIPSVPQSPKWWRNIVMYQIYPRSFKDSNGDGIGDLQGIIDSLDYLNGSSNSLGIGAIWLSPVYPSPMFDHGYDVSDYRNIDPSFGTLTIFNRLIEAAHQHSIRVIMDLVANHTSDQHPWFIKSRASRNNSLRDWYVWRDPAPDGGPPNNWLSYFGGSAWTLDKTTNQYYLHKFAPQQPDLNNWNPKVNQALVDIMHFWLKRGVDGFRMDVVDRLLFDPTFKDAPCNLAYKKNVDPQVKKFDFSKTYYQPEVHQIIAVFRRVLDLYDAVGIGEVEARSIDFIQRFYDHGRGVQLPFDFLLLKTPWEAKKIGAHLKMYEKKLPRSSWPMYVLGNHDKERLADRIGKHNLKLAALMLLTLHGTPMMYYGDEIGLASMPLSKDKWQDAYTKNTKSDWTRDYSRGPMQWNSSKYVGFSTHVPWLPPNEFKNEQNVQEQEKGPNSILHLYKSLIKLRNNHRSLSEGTFELIYDGSEGVIGYLRSFRTEKMLILLNFTSTIKQLRLKHKGLLGTVIMRTHTHNNPQDLVCTIHLKPKEGCILKLEKN